MHLLKVVFENSAHNGDGGFRFRKRQNGRTIAKWTQVGHNKAASELLTLITQTRTELEGLRGKGSEPEVFDRIAELDRRMIELEQFKEKLERIQEGRDREARGGQGDKIDNGGCGT